MTPEEKLAIARQSTNTLLPHLYRHTVTVIDTNDNESDPSKWGIFSGTLVEVRDKLFVATASHCLEDLSFPTRYWILGDSPRFKSDGIPDVIATHGSPGNRPDVGIMELERSSFEQFSSKAGLPISRIKIVGLGRPKRIALLVGSPGQYVESETRGAASGFKSVVIGYSSLPIESSEWPSFSASPPWDLDIDILMEYPRGSTDTERLDTGEPVELPNPKGMSGGGLWDQGFDTDEIWSCDSAFLFGIQSAWFRDKRYVRAVQVQHWLALLHHHYSHLRSDLESQFPELR